MSRGDYYEKEKAALHIGHALERRGWKLSRWNEDRSDSMTDYWAPESWDGVAQKGEFVTCVNVGRYIAENRSGSPETRLIPVPGGPNFLLPSSLLPSLGPPLTPRFVPEGRAAARQPCGRA
jgi:hypothetical protein